VHRSPICHHIYDLIYPSVMFAALYRALNGAFLLTSLLSTSPLVTAFLIVICQSTTPSGYMSTKSNRKFVTLNTHIHDCLLSWVWKGTSINQSGRIKIVLFMVPNIRSMWTDEMRNTWSSLCVYNVSENRRGNPEWYLQNAIQNDIYSKLYWGI